MNRNSTVLALVLSVLGGVLFGAGGLFGGFACGEALGIALNHVGDGIH